MRHESNNKWFASTSALAPAVKLHIYFKNENNNQAYE